MWWVYDVCSGKLKDVGVMEVIMGESDGSKLESSSLSSGICDKQANL